MGKNIAPSGRTLDEIRKEARECFFKKNGYYPTEEDCVRLTDEARQEIKKKREQTTAKHISYFW